MTRLFNTLPTSVGLMVVVAVIVLLPRHPLGGGVPAPQPADSFPAPSKPDLRPPPIPVFHANGPAHDGTVSTSDAMMQSREIAAVRHLDRLHLQAQIRALAHCDAVAACGLTRLDVATLNTVLTAARPAP